MIYMNPQDRFKKTEATEEPSQKYTVKELKSMCKEKGLTGYSKLNEAKLIELLGL